MARGPKDVALSATASGVMFVAAVAVVLIVYALLTFVDLLPASLSTQDLVGLFD